MATQVTAQAEAPNVAEVKPTPAVEFLRTVIENETRARYEARFVKEIADFRAKLQIENDAALQEVIKEFKESQKPPSEEEIRKLLSQDYLTFDVEVPWEYENSTQKTRKFTIKELPQSVEKKFYKQFKEEIIPRASELGSLTFDTLEGDVGKRIVSLLEALDPAFDLMADAVVMILNPRGKEKEITQEWVQDNLSSYRQWNIINAQVQVNKLRDFFSQISRGSRGTMTTLGARTRN